MQNSVSTVAEELPNGEIEVESTSNISATPALRSGRRRSNLPADRFRSRSCEDRLCYCRRQRYTRSCLKSESCAPFFRLPNMTSRSCSAKCCRPPSPEEQMFGRFGYLAAASAALLIAGLAGSHAQDKKYDIVTV